MSDVLALVTPILRGERVLAVVPFVLRFVADGAEATRSEAARAVMALAGAGDLGSPAPTWLRAGRSLVHSTLAWSAARRAGPLVF